MKVTVSKVKNISGKIIHVEIEEEIPFLSVEGDALKLAAPLRFSGQVENTGKTLAVSGVIDTKVELPCSRCMKNIAYKATVPFHEIFTNIKDLTVNSNGEEEVFLFEGDEIDISSQVTRAILLELPMKILCREDCKGLCPKCGVNLNFEECRCTSDTVDPRFAVLEKLLNQSSTKGGVISGSTKEKNL